MTTHRRLDALIRAALWLLLFGMIVSALGAFG